VREWTQYDLLSTKVLQPASTSTSEKVLHSTSPRDQKLSIVLFQDSFLVSALRVQEWSAWDLVDIEATMHATPNTGQYSTASGIHKQVCAELTCSLHCWPRSSPLELLVQVRGIVSERRLAKLS